MDHDLQLIIGILEMLEIEVSNILYNPGNIGNLNCLISHILEILEIWVFQFSTILEMLEISVVLFPGIVNILKTCFAGGRAAGRDSFDGKKLRGGSTAKQRL